MGWSPPCEILNTPLAPPLASGVARIGFWSRRGTRTLVDLEMDWRGQGHMPFSSKRFLYKAV